jgi:hypothetical protein
MDDWSPRQATAFGAALAALSFGCAIATAAAVAGAVALVDRIRAARRRPDRRIP